MKKVAHVAILTLSQSGLADAMLSSLPMNVHSVRREHQQASLIVKS